MSEKKYKDKDVLYRLYHEEGLSQKEIAERLDVAQKTISNWMRKHEIERRDVAGTKKTPRRKTVNFRVDEKGYEVWTPTVGTQTPDIPVHQLLAVAEYGLESLKEKDVHHKNNIRWDNRPDNIELLDPSTHISLHAKERNQDRNPDTGKFVSTGGA